MTVKESNEWVRQQQVDKAADEILADRQCDVSEVKAYQVAKRLDCDANGAIHAKVRDWRHRRRAEMETAAIDIPPGFQAQFRGILDRMVMEAGDHFVRAVRSVGGDLDRSATLRVTDAERRRDEAEEETAEIVELCQKTEAKLADAHTRIAALEQALADAQRREDTLRGRLEQRQADAAVSAGPQAQPDQSVTRAADTGTDNSAQHVMGFVDPDGGQV